MEQRRNAGMFAASVAVSAIAAADSGWTSVLLGWLMGGALLRILPAGKKPGKVGAALILLVGTAVLAAAAMGAEEAFPEDTTFPFVSAVMLLLVWRSLIGEKESPAVVANILGMLLLPLLTAMVLFGLENVSWQENMPELPQWRPVLIALTAACPWWCFRRSRTEKSGWLWFGAAAALSIGMSLLTRGVLGSALAEQERFPLYRAIQAIHVLGILQRMEALLAVTVMLGAFSVMFLTAGRMKEAAEILCPGVKWKIAGGVIVGTAFLLENAVRILSQGNFSALETIFWAWIPIFALGIVVFGKKKKETEKT